MTFAVTEEVKSTPVTADVTTKDLQPDAVTTDAVLSTFAGEDDDVGPPGDTDPPDEVSDSPYIMLFYYYNYLLIYRYILSI